MPTVSARRHAYSASLGSAYRVTEKHPVLKDDAFLDLRTHLQRGRALAWERSLNRSARHDPKREPNRSDLAGKAEKDPLRTLRRQGACHLRRTHPPPFGRRRCDATPRA